MLEEHRCRSCHITFCCSCCCIDLLLCLVHTVTDQVGVVHRTPFDRFLLLGITLPVGLGLVKQPRVLGNMLLAIQPLVQRTMLQQLLLLLVRFIHAHHSDLFALVVAMLQLHVVLECQWLLLVAPIIQGTPEHLDVLSI